MKASTEFVRGRFIHGYLAVPLNVHVNRFLLFFDRKCALKATHLDNQSRSTLEKTRSVGSTGRRDRYVFDSGGAAPTERQYRHQEDSK